MTRISVVTISYNQAGFLEQALDSVLAQRGVEIEYIVVDPGSTDGSRDIIERYRNRLAAVILDKDEGPADGLNKGLARATGEFFYYLNSDDVVRPGAFAQAVDAFARHPQAAVIYGNGVIVDAAGRVVRPVYSSPWVTPKLYARGLSTVLQQATFLRTEWLRRVGGFNAENKTCWDGEVVFDIARAGGVCRRVWRDWGVFRIYDGSISGSGRLLERYRADQRRIALTAGVSPPERRSLATMVLYAATRALDLPRLNAEARRLTGRPGAAG